MSSCVPRTKALGRDKTEDKRRHQAESYRHPSLLCGYLLPQTLRPSPGSFRDARVRISLKMSLYLLVVSVVLTSVVAEHSGAYSSPQYAKKMFPKQGVNNIDLLPREKPPVPFKRPAPYDEGDTIDRVGTDSNDTAQYGRSSFLNTAGSFLNGAGGQIVSTLAKDFIARSTGSSQVGFDCISQVLSLNLTNLVILVVLKALILAAGFFGAGAWKGHHYGRSLEDNLNATYISEDELYLYLAYLSGRQSGRYGCLYRLACARPRQAAPYASGAELLMQGAKLLQG
ncbi:unnamed protein product [Plutella xylostella]|uniref:(diamondback moth) hypothetical protein n=1 Tax=Plutella xylostella TaxID=51655 RepID=A0A8S4F3M7_PLUXY|nr:unnamed protein product [Plutella xylostella]